MTIFDMLEMMDSAARDQVVAQMDESMDSMPDTMVEQAATLYIQSAYEELGIDMDAMQTHYILVTGGKMLALAALGMLASIMVGLMASRVAASVGREPGERSSRRWSDFPMGNSTNSPQRPSSPGAPMTSSRSRC